MSRMRWGIIAPGKIARRFAEQLPLSATGALHAVASRDEDRARTFADEFGAQRWYTRYEDLLADPDVEAVYIASPHTHHAAWAVAAARAGKHILCEKPLTPSAAFSMAVVEAVKEAGVALLEGFMYRFHPQIVQVLDLVRSGAIGEVSHVDAAFAFAVPPDEGRLFSAALAGGGILDVGGYPLSLVRFVAAAAGYDADALTTLTAKGTVRDDGVDEWATASLAFAGGMTAHVTCGIRNRDENRVRIFGSKGVITIPIPWVVEPDSTAEFEIRLSGQPLESVTVPAAAPYALEADALAAARERGETPEITWSDSLAIAAWQGRWREAIGARYPQEAPNAPAPSVTGGPLRRAEDAPMAYGSVEGVDTPVSRLVLGCDNQQTLTHASVMFDGFVEHGGNVFDTAFSYGRGLQEKLLGQWMASRGVRDEIVVIGKGAHTPHCDPDSIDVELLISLDRLQTDRLDLYFMHRDNLEVPVGEFVDVLDAHVRAGRIRAFGGSNWTPARVDEANEYARLNGKHGFTALSNHFGLAYPLELPWKGCEHAIDEGSREWLVRRGMPLFPWSSQARGFFGRPDPRTDGSDPQLVRCYYSPENFARYDRVQQLARERGVSPTTIALAYVLAQPFPTFPLIGPRSLAEMRPSLAALAVRLSDAELRWLDLRSPSRGERHGRATKSKIL